MIKFINNTKFELFLMSLIFLNLLAFVLQSDTNFANKFQEQFYHFEVFSVVIFTFEYILRVIGIKNKKDIFKPLMLIDLFAILPFYFSCIPFDTMVLRSLRLFRIFKILKIARYIEAFDNIKKAFIKRKDEIIISMFIFLLAVLVSSILIFYAEHNTGNEVYSSIISSFWWAVITITTVGYGDAYPVTVLGKIISSITAVFGVILHGVLIGVISTAIMEIITGGADNE